jgi:hypothetical protein
MKPSYPIRPHQQRMIDDVKKLSPKRLFYVVIQQNRAEMNFTLPELKKHLQYSIKRYVKDFFSIEYRTRLEKELIQYVCFFETTKEFNQSLYQEKVRDGIYEGFHFHLFISSRSGEVHIPQLIHYLFWSLTSQVLKAKALNKFDYRRVDNLDDHFIQYHTKQHYHKEVTEMFMRNL